MNAEEAGILVLDGLLAKMMCQSVGAGGKHGKGMDNVCCSSLYSRYGISLERLCFLMLVYLWHWLLDGVVPLSGASSLIYPFCLLQKQFHRDVALTALPHYCPMGFIPLLVSHSSLPFWMVAIALSFLMS